MSDNDELVKRIANLEAELAGLKAQLKPREEFVPKPMPRYDPTEGMSASGPALKGMVDLVNPKDVKFDRSAWARNSYPQPGGFGGPPGSKPTPEVRKSEGQVVKNGRYMSVTDGLWSKPK